MPKQFFKRRYKCMIVLCHVIIFTLLIGVASDLFGHCLLEDNSGSLIFVDPLSREDDYTTSDAYRYAFGTDSSRLVKYLAVCRQFESNGEFDKDKEVDILEYYTRKSTDRRLTSNGLLRYRIQDLINWNNSYGFETLDDECLREVFLPTDGVSIYLKKERLKELLSGLSDVQSVPEDEVLSGQQILVEEQEEAYAEEDVAADPAMADQVTKLVGNILMEVSGDLAYNYSLYEEWKDYYLSSGTNFKYLYLPQNDEVDGKQSFYSNLGLKDRKEAVAVSRRFAGCMDVYLVIDAASGNIEEKSKAVFRGELQAGLSTYNYVFREHGGRIYIGVLKEGENSIAKYHEDDMYAMIDDCYRFFARYENQYLALLLGLLVLSLVTLAAFMIQCGRVEEDEQIHLIAFDRWYTEIAFCLGAGLAVGVFGIYVVSMSEMLSVSSLLRFAKGSFFLILHGTLALLLDLAFLFFYGSLVRRIKAGILLKGSLIGKLWQALKRACVRIKKGMWWVYRNAGVTGKTILRFIPIFILMHLHLLAGMWESAAMLIFCWLLDVLLFVMLLYNAAVTSRIVGGIDKISSGELEYQVDTGHIYGDNLQLANAVNHIGDGIRQAVEQSMKDERMKADLITNVSHDIKTPLTSIINYVDLLKREHVEDETIRGYIEVLDSKSQRLKQLTDDLVEASKISSGNIVLHMEQLNVVELMQQALGEFTDRFAEKQLSLITDFPDTPCMIHADSRRMWRVIDNLLGNIYKYSMENTRVYMEVKDLSSVGNQVSISIKNISKQPLNIDAEELTERFIRGDVSRSTEGSGLGLSIAKNLVEAQGGEFRLYLDGDLFKVIMQF